MEDIGRGIPGGQDLKGQPPERHREVLNQWNFPGRDSPVEDIGRGIPGGQDLKEQPPDRHLKGLNQWNIPDKDHPVEDIGRGSSVPGRGEEKERMVQEEAAMDEEGDMEQGLESREEL